MLLARVSKVAGLNPIYDYKCSSYAARASYHTVFLAHPVLAIPCDVDQNNQLEHGAPINIGSLSATRMHPCRLGFNIQYDSKHHGKHKPDDNVVGPG